MHARIRRAAIHILPFLVLSVVAGCNRISIRERDDTAGLNGGFETVRNGLPVNWYFYRAPLDAGTAVIVPDSVDRVEGRRSVRLDVRGFDPAGRTRAAGFFQVIPAEAGRTYRVSFWLKNPDGPVRFVLRSERPEDASERSIVDLPAHDVWQPLEFTYAVPAGYANIRFEITALGPGVIHMDDARID